MKISLVLLMLALAAIPANFAYSETPAPGKQAAQTIELPANTVVRLRQTEEQRAAEKTRRDALTQEERDAEDLERRLKSFEEMKNPKPLSETEKQTVGYWLFLPNDYDEEAGKTWPLLLFLHGSGERGSDIDKVKVHGPPKLLDDPAIASVCPFITVSPQCPDDQSWSPLQLGLLLDELEKRYAVDKDRVYVTGLSMGGFGTWGLLYQFPDRFAAGAPICGGFDPAAAERFVDIPLWVFHGAQDAAVKVTMSSDLVEAIRAAGGNRVQLTVYPDLEHDSWTVTYDNRELYRWLLRQSVGKRAMVDNKSIPIPKLEAFYQEINGHPVLTVMLTNIGQVPFAILNPFETFYIRVEVLDSQGKDLLKERDGSGASSVPEHATILTKLKSQRGIHCKIDLFDGFTSMAMGHSTRGEMMLHWPAMFAMTENISPEDVAKIHKIRVVLKNESELSTDTVFAFSHGVGLLYNIDPKKENMFDGQRQILEISLGEKVNRAVQQFGQLVELGEPVRPQLESDRILQFTPAPTVQPMVPPELLMRQR